MTTKNPHSHKVIGDQVRALKEQRDALLEVLCKADEDFEREGFGEEGPYRAPIRAVIAKVKGAQS